jgi:hypothetical protein
MFKHTTFAVLLLGSIVSPSAFSGLSAAAQPAQVPGRCLHGPNEARSQAARREQAYKMAQQINRAENGPIAIPFGKREYRPFDQLRDLPAVPNGFHLQFHTDGATYMFSLKDTLDACRFAIYSDQDQDIYEGAPHSVAHILPVETR